MVFLAAEKSDALSFINEYPNKFDQFLSEDINSIYEFFKNKTVIMISRRFSTVRNADRIIVLDHGKIIEEGSHEYLMSINGYYAKVFNLQARGYEG